MKRGAGKRLWMILVASWLLLGTAPASGYGIEAVTAGVSTTAAAAHPDFTTRLELTPAVGEGSPRVEDVIVNLPPGLYGNPNLIPRCTTGEFVGGFCPQDAQVGISRIALHNFCEPIACTIPIFNLALVDPQKEIARFGFAAPAFPVFIDVSVRTAGDFGVTAAVRSASGLEPLEAAETVFWGDPADASHDPQRMTIAEGIMCSSPCEESDGERSSGIDPVAFMSNPSA
jgi:hypothetical protein